MKGYEIVREETARLARGHGAARAYRVRHPAGLAGFEPLRTGVSLLAGTAYSILLFAMIGRSAARAVLFPPAQGTRIVRRGYFFRYLLTGAAVFAGDQAAAAPAACGDPAALLPEAHSSLAAGAPLRAKGRRGKRHLTHSKGKEVRR